MRAARVLEMLLILQRRGRLTAGELAAELEVSERTILRDVEALSEAGIAIYASRGSGGGIELLDGFRTRLTGLTPAEARSLFLAGQPAVAHRLGFGAPARSAGHKLATALPAGLAAEAESLGAWFLHDPDPWDGHRIPHGELRRIAESIRRRRRVELYLGEDPPVAVEPLGLVLKAGSWHLVASAGGTPSVLDLGNLRATRLTTQEFAPPPGFSLAGFWADRISAGPERARRRR